MSSGASDPLRVLRDLGDDERMKAVFQPQQDEGGGPSTPADNAAGVGPSGASEPMPTQPVVQPRVIQPSPAQPSPMVVQQPAATQAAIPMVEHTQAQDSYVRDDPKARAAADKARSEYEKTVLEGAKLGAEKAAEVSAYRQENARQMAVEASAEQRAELVHQQRIAAAEQDQAAALDELMKAKPDPQRFWKEQGTAGSIIAAIGIALGGVAQAINGGPNPAYEMIRGAIDRDINAQDKEIQLLRDKVNFKTNTLARLMNQMQDARVARSLLRESRLRIVAAQLEAKLQPGAADVMQGAAETIKKLQLEAAQEQRNRSSHTVSVMKAKQPAITQAELRKMNDEQQRRYVPDAGAFALSPEQATKLNEYAATNNVLVGDIKALRRLVQAHGNESFGTAKAKMMQIRNRIITAMNKEAGLGAMSGSDRELIEGQIADPTKFFARGAKTDELLGGLEETFANAKLNTYKSYGLTPQ